MKKIKLNRDLTPKYFNKPLKLTNFAGFYFNNIQD